MRSIHTLHKALVCFLLFAAGAFTAQAQAPADICAAAPIIGNNTVITGTTAGATFDNVGTCGTSNTAPGVWVALVGTGGQQTVETCGGLTAYDTKISVFSGSCGALTCVDGNDDACGLQSSVTFNTTPGLLYYVLIHGFSSNTGTFSLTTTVNLAPANDACAAAIPVACGQTVNGSTDFATADNAGTCVTTNTAPGVWYQLVGPSTGNVTASLCGAGTNYDSKISVYTGSCGALTCVTGNDDFCGLQSEVTFTSTPGQIYYILVHGFGTASGDFDLAITCPNPITNDDVCGATPVTFGTTAFDNTTATAQTGEPDPGAGTDVSSCNSQDGWCSFELDVDNSVWFTFQAPASGCVSIVADGFDSQVALWDVTDCNDFTTFVEIAANDDSGDDIVPTANLFSGGIIEAACLIPGRTYYIQVDGYNGATSSSGSLILIDCGGVLPSVDAGECQSRYLGYAPAAADTNFLVATATGVSPFTYTWTTAGDPDIYFQVDGDSTSTIAVQPDSTTTYTVTITDSRGCTATSSVDVNVFDVSCGNGGVELCCTPQSSGILLCDFDTDGNGNFLPEGREITNQYANRGVRISADNMGGGPDAAVIFNSSVPTGGDFDLGTPNMDFGGPGIGNGGRLGQPGANNVPLGKLLIVQERNQRGCGPGGMDFCVPDDEAGGGKLIFEFDCPTTILDVVIVDADDGNPSGAVLTFNGGSNSVGIPNLGNNSTQTVYVNQPAVTRMEVEFAGSGALASFHYKPDTSNICVDPTMVDVDSMLNDPRYSLGPCGNPCTATNASVPAPPSCVDLVVTVTTDDFASETSWEIVDLNSNQTVGTRQFTFNDDLTTFNDTFCVDPTRCYAVRIDDSFGDGICCTFGNGDWSVTFDGVTTASPSGGQFGSSETIQVGNCSPNKEDQPASPVAEMLTSELEIMAYPNPASDETTIKFRVPQTGPVKVELYALTGLRVATVFHGVAEADASQFVNFDTRSLPAGTYIYRIATDNGFKSGKLQVAR